MLEPEEKKTQYKLLSGTHSVGGRRYRVGEIFSEFPSRVEWMKKRVKLVGPPPEPIPERKPELELIDVTTMQDGGKRFYDVINSVTGQKVNDSRLTKQEAEAIVGKITPSGDELKYKKVHIGGGYYWVMEIQTEKKMHDKALRSAAAEELLTRLENQGDDDNADVGKEEATNTTSTDPEEGTGE